MYISTYTKWCQSTEYDQSYAIPGFGICNSKFSDDEGVEKIPKNMSEIEKFKQKFAKISILTFFFRIQIYTIYINL